jgi:hypothetical protein
MIKNPISVYINWAAYDELSDNVELTEAIAMEQLEHLLRLRKLGVRFDYYVMDAFWYARASGYRAWRQPHWPNGPEAWLKKCLENDVKPGLWLGSNALWCQLEATAAWRDSVSSSGNSCCLFQGGFLNDFLAMMHEWYERGVRLFKFDFADFAAATPEVERTMLPSEIRAANIAAFSAGLKSFRQLHPEVVLIAYNGFEEVMTMQNTSVPVRKAIDTHWLEVFDSIYCGDPRPADVPAMRFWRAKDVYSDHQVRVYESSGFPLPRIDNTAFMVANTGTCYFRKTEAWKGMLILSLARGGWVNTYYGNLDLLDEVQAAWFAKAQGMFMELQQTGRSSTFGGWPGRGEPYGFLARQPAGALVTVVNPSQSVATLALPALGHQWKRLLFRDAGFEPVLKAEAITLGPEQMVVVGLGCYANETHDLGVQDDVVIPRQIEPLTAEFMADGAHAITTTIEPPANGFIRFGIQLTAKNGQGHRLSGGSPPKGKPLNELIQLSATQDGKPVAIRIEYDKQIWSGLSWAMGEIDAASLRASLPLTLRGCADCGETLNITGQVYRVQY